VDAARSIEWGFDRLRGGTVTRWSAVVLLGNLGDAMSTLTFLQLHLAHEVNPLMRMAYQLSPVSFMAAKIALVNLGLMLLYLNRHLRFAKLGEAVGASMYVGILAWHLACWTSL
jgi:hypothetical protein